MFLYETYPCKEIRAKVTKIISKDVNLEEYRDYSVQERMDNMRNMPGYHRSAVSLFDDNDMYPRDSYTGERYTIRHKWENQYTIETEYTVKGVTYQKTLKLRKHPEYLEEGGNVTICYDRKDPAKVFDTYQNKTIDDCIRRTLFVLFSVTVILAGLGYLVALIWKSYQQS